MKSSLGKLITLMESFANRHPLINTFEVKPVTDYVANNWIYPVMWVNLPGTTAAFAKGAVNLTIPVFVLDRVEEDTSNYASVKSSTLLTINDFLSYFQDQFDCLYGISFSSASNLTGQYLQFEDRAAGWSANVTVHMLQSYNESEIPIS